VIKKLNCPELERPSRQKVFEEYVDESYTKYCPDDDDFKYYKNIKEEQ
jgi:hypothetical protein